MVHYQDEDVTRDIIAAAIEVHKNLGPGLLESAYKTCLGLEFEERRIQYKCEMEVPLVYKNKQVDCGFRVDFLVEDKIVVELKAVEHILPVHEAQVLTYLRVLRKEVGLLLNFNVPFLKNGIRRCILNTYKEEESDWIKL